MPEFSHSVFGSVGRAERPEVPAHQPAAVAQPQPVPQGIPDEQPMANDDLRLLIECGKVTDTIEIDGQRFQLSTMADEAQEEIFRKFSAAAADVGSFVELRRTVVATAIDTMNGRPLESIYPADAPPQPDAFGAKLALVRLMQPPVVDRLYAFHDELLKRSKQKVEPEQVKN